MPLLPLFCTMERRQVEQPYTASGDSPICIAIRESYLDSAFHLARHGFAVDVPDRNGDSPLHLAVREKNKDLVCTLLANGSCPNVIDSNGMTPLHIAILQKSTDLVSLLLENGANPENLPICDSRAVTSPLRLAVSGRSEEAAELLLKAGADPDKIDVFGQTNFIRALALEKEMGKLPLLMVQHSKALDQRCYRGQSNLSWALHQNCCDTAHAILERIASQNIENQPDYHPILIAIKNGCWTCFDDLIKFRGVEQFHTSEKDLPSALELALAPDSWRMASIASNSKKLFQKNYTIANDTRFEFAQVLVTKYGVDVGDPFYESILRDCTSFRNNTLTSQKVISLCISAYGGFWDLCAKDYKKYERVRALFETLGKCQTYDLMYRLHEAGFCYNTGNVLSIHHHHERTNISLDIVDELNQLKKEVRSLKNLAALRVRSCLQSNVIYGSQSLGVPKLIQSIISLGTY